MPNFKYFTAARGRDIWGCPLREIGNDSFHEESRTREDSFSGGRYFTPYFFSPLEIVYRHLIIYAPVMFVTSKIKLYHFPLLLSIRFFSSSLLLFSFLKTLFLFRLFDHFSAIAQTYRLRYDSTSRQSYHEGTRYEGCIGRCCLA